MSQGSVCSLSTRRSFQAAHKRTLLTDIGDGIGAKYIVSHCRRNIRQDTSRSHFVSIHPSCPTSEQDFFSWRYVVLTAPRRQLQIHLLDFTFISSLDFVREVRLSRHPRDLSDLPVLRSGNPRWHRISVRPHHGCEVRSCNSCFLRDNFLRVKIQSALREVSSIRSAQFFTSVNVVSFSHFGSASSPRFTPSAVARRSHGRLSSQAS